MRLLDPVRKTCLGLGMRRLAANSGVGAYTIVGGGGVRLLAQSANAPGIAPSASQNGPGSGGRACPVSGFQLAWGVQVSQPASFQTNRL